MPGHDFSQRLYQLAIDVSELVRVPEGMARFREKVREWYAYQQGRDVNRDVWEHRRREHFKAVVSEDRLCDFEKGPPEPGWLWEFQRQSEWTECPQIEGWTPPDLAQSRRPNAHLPIPLPKRSLLLVERYVVLAVIRDHFFGKGVEPINPWHSAPHNAESESLPPEFWYLSLVNVLVPLLKTDDLKVLGEYLKDVREDVEKLRPEDDQQRLNRELEDVQADMAKVRELEIVARERSEPETTSLATGSPPRAEGDLEVDKVRPCDKRARSQYNWAVEQDPALSTDRQVYDWLRESRSIEADELPKRFDTWVRYLQRARKAYGESKNTPRIGNPTKSVVRQDQI